LSLLGFKVSRSGDKGPKDLILANSIGLSKIKVFFADSLIVKKVAKFYQPKMVINRSVGQNYIYFITPLHNSQLF
jgi:hypothetical protein